MGRDTVEPELIIPRELRIGEFANAVRIRPEMDNDCTVEFFHFSSQENTAKLVSKVRVRAEFLRTVRDRINEILGEKSVPISPPETTYAVHEDGIAILIDGKPAQVIKTGGEDN